MKNESIVDFVIDNYGVIVTENNGFFVCQSCGSTGAFANEVVHGDNCVLSGIRLGPGIKVG